MSSTTGGLLLVFAVLLPFAGVFIADAFLAYPDGFAKPLIVVIEWALFPSLAVTLALIVAGVPLRDGVPGRHGT
jgi:hypothetical protein